MRLRSANLREVLRDRKTWWVQHVQGSSLVTDGLTKPLQGQQFMRYRQMLNLRPGDELGVPDASYVGERSTSQEGRIPYRAESGASSSAGYAKGGTSCRGKAAMQQVVTPKPQSVHVDALKVTVNVENAEAEKQEKKPWMLPRFQSFNSGSSDGWMMDYLNDGWLVRDRRRGRKTARHPVHRRLPSETDRLLHERTTVRFLEDGGREVHCDDWRTSSRFEGKTWRGYTFIRVSQPDLGTRQSRPMEMNTLMMTMIARSSSTLKRRALSCSSSRFLEVSNP